jgi:hypothetical protein
MINVVSVTGMMMRMVSDRVTVRCDIEFTSVTVTEYESVNQGERQKRDMRTRGG